MPWQPNIFTPILIVTAGLALAVSIICVKRRSKPGAIYLSSTMFALCVWSFCLGAEYAAASNGWRVFWYTFRIVGVAFAPTSLLLFAIEFSNLSISSKIQSHLKYYGIVPTLISVTALTNGLHHGYWNGYLAASRGQFTVLVYNHGILYWLFYVVTGAILLGAMLLFLLGIIRYKYKFRLQAFLLIIASILVISGCATMRQLRNVHQIDATGVMFLIASALIFIDITFLDLLELTPVSPDYLQNCFTDAAIVIDRKGRIIDLNVLGAAILNAPASKLLGTSLRDRLQALPPSPHRHSITTRQLGVSSFMVNGEERWYELRTNSPAGLVGSILYFDDVTSRREMDTKLAIERRRANQLINIAQISTETLDLDEMMRSTLQLTCQITQSKSGLLVLFSEIGKPLHHMSYGTAIPETQCVAIADFIRQRQKPINIPDVLTNQLWVGMSEFDTPTGGSVIGLPLYYGKQISGALVFYHPARNHFDQTDAMVLEAATRQMALALGNALVIHGQRMVSDAQTTLFETLRALQRPMSIGEAMTQVTGVIARRTGWPLVALLAYDVSGQAAVFTAAGRLAGAFKKQYLVNRKNVRSGASPLSVFHIEEFPSAVLLPLSGMSRHLLLIASDFPDVFDDHTRWLANSLGNVAGLVLRNAQLNDDMVTEQRRLSALVQSSHEGIVMISNEGKLLVISQQALHLVGMKHTSDYWLAKTLPDVLMQMRDTAPEFVREMIREIRRTDDGDTSTNEGEIRVADLTLAWTNLPVHYNRRNYGRLFMLRDITEERQIAQMRDDLTHTMVHDLKSPLTGIHSSLLLLEDRVQDTGNDEHAIIELAKRSNDRLLQLINSILDISRLESGRMPLNLQFFSIYHLVVDIILSQTPAATERRISLENEVSENTPMVTADRELIARVLENITSNALKFTPRDGVIRISTEVKNEQVLVSVYNSGPGIPPEVKPRLFQKFVTGLQKGHGSGLGLAFCRMVLEAHKQKIWADSTPNEGATFTFTLASTK